MYEFKTKREPFARGFLSCDSENKSKRCAAGMIQTAKDMDLKIDLKLGLCYAEMDTFLNVFYNFCGLFEWDDNLNKLIAKYPEERILEVLRDEINQM